MVQECGLTWLRVKMMMLRHLRYNSRNKRAGGRKILLMAGNMKSLKQLAPLSLQLLCVADATGPGIM